MIDVCLLLEGTYPYVAGGVSTWVHQLVSALEDLRFGIVYVAPHSDPTRTFKYDVPRHVLSLKEVNLHDYDLESRAARAPRPKDFAVLAEVYAKVLEGKESDADFAAFVSLFRGETDCLDAATVFTAKEVWDMLVSFYERLAPSVSFLDFFWTWRGTHLPLMQVLRAELPPARVYHAVSTGYAGLIGAVAKVATGAGFFLTEHGIYTHERMLEISQADWIYERERRRYRAERELSFFKQWWIGMFRAMSRMAYRRADRIFTLFGGNRVRQIAEGADPSRIEIVPNGLDLGLYENFPREPRAAPHVALIGRVVAIKDVKTYLQAARLVIDESPEARFLVAGPVEEEEEYVAECRAMTESLGLSGRVEFTGRVDVAGLYRFLDVVVLTSLSEAQPYVILEANAAGIPVVATDVGACREMLEGASPEDRALGASGLLTEVANARATADAVLKLLREPGRGRAYGEAGQRRVRRFYDQNDLLSRYLNAYETCL